MNDVRMSSFEALYKHLFVVIEILSKLCCFEDQGPVRVQR